MYSFEIKRENGRIFVFCPYSIASRSLRRSPPRARPAAAGRTKTPWQTAKTPLLKHGAQAPPGSTGACQVSPRRATTSATQAPLASGLPEGKAWRPGTGGGPPVVSAAPVQCAAQRRGRAAAPGASGGPARSARDAAKSATAACLLGFGGPDGHARGPRHPQAAPRHRLPGWLLPRPPPSRHRRLPPQLRAQARARRAPRLHPP